MKRRLIKLLAALAMLLCIPVGILWHQSFTATWQTEFGFARVGPHGGIESADEWEWHVSSSSGYFDVSPECSFFEWKTPYWKIVLLLLSWPIAYFVPWDLLSMRQQRIQHGLCPTCGYDLRAT